MTMPNPRLKAVAYLPSPTHEKASAIAARKGISLSALINIALGEYIATIALLDSFKGGSHAEDL
jgi:hypothetical protein